MKKLIMLAGLLAVFNLSMAGVETGGNQYEGITAEVGVDATVVEPLEIVEVQNVAFGLIPKGTTKEKPDTEGKIGISGEGNRWVKLSLTEFDNPNGTNLLAEENPSVLLVSNGQNDATADTAVTYNLKANKGDKAQLDAEGKLAINLTGSATAGANAKSVTYGRMLTFKVVYDFDK